MLGLPEKSILFSRKMWKTQEENKVSSQGGWGESAPAYRIYLAERYTPHFRIFAIFLSRGVWGSAPIYK